MTLPSNNKLPINLLAACFNKTSATYKYYWFISILQEIELGKEIISKKELFSRMISNAWYTVNYFRLSFGKQDLIIDAIKNIIDQEKITIDENQSSIIQQLTHCSNPSVLNQLTHFDKQVPHWFLTPWFQKAGDESDSRRINRIYIESKGFSNDCLYSLSVDSIQINPIWLEYLKSNSRILKDYSYWNLALFLQSKNPNVPDIPNKLIKPATRNNLSKQRTKYWDLVIKELGSVSCIYTGKRLTIGDYAVEHFVPYSFVSHDLIWNLIPADNSFNSSKSNKLPLFEKHFDSYFSLQNEALDIIRKVDSKNRYLEDYLTIFPDLNELELLSDVLKKERFKESIQPLITIASNNGFEFMNG